MKTIPAHCRRSLLLRSATLASGYALLLATVCVPGAAALEDSAPSCDRRLRAEACFAPGTPPELVDEIARRLVGSGLSLAAPQQDYQYVDGDRWQATATDGGGLVEGQPTTLTWSYVPDGTAVCGYIGEAAGNSNLRGWLNGLYGNFAAWHAVFQQMFDRWSLLTGTRYVYEPNDDGAAFACATLPNGSLGVRGDIRIAAHVIDGNFGVLAYNFFPDAGEMVIDSNDSFYADKSSNSVKLRNVLAHEHGHGLGLPHTCPVNQTKLMEPYLTTAFDGPQADDILAVNRGYGDDHEDDDSSTTALALGPLAVGANIALDPLSIDDNSDRDFLSIDVSEPLKVTIVATPTGSTYLSGPQNGDGTCSPGSNYDSLRVHDLGLALLDVNGATVLASATGNPIGMSETIASFDLAAPGTYFVRVTGSATNSAQLYSLALSTAPLNTPSLTLMGSVSPPANPHPVGSELSYLLTVNNGGTAAADGVVIRTCLDPLFDSLQLTLLDGGVLNQAPAPGGCAGDWITWTLAMPIAADSSASVSFRAFIPLATPEGATLSNGAEVVSNQTPASMSAAMVATVCAPTLALTMADDQATYAEGDPVIWTLTASNSHVSCASTGITLTDVINLLLVEDEPTLTWSTPSGASSSASNGTISWSLPALGPGESAVITVASAVLPGTAGATLCAQASGSWAQGASVVGSNAACSSIAGGCPVSGVPVVSGLTVVKGPGVAELTASWSPASLAQEYDLWRIIGDKTAIVSAGRGAAAPVSAVTGCADPAPTAMLSCLDSLAPSPAGLDFYQVRGVCGGVEGAI